jgi:hypothetical protein
MVRARRRRKGRFYPMPVSSRRGNTNRRVSGTLSQFPAAQGKGACLPVWLFRMLQGGQGARAEQDRNVVFSVDFSIYIRDPYLLHCHCFPTCFFVASPTEMIFKARGCACVTNTRIADGEYLFITIFLTATCETQSNFSIHATH